MLVYAGTYQGNVVILYSDLTNLQLKTIKQVSDVNAHQSRILCGQ